MRKRSLARFSVLCVVLAAAGACTSPTENKANPDLAPRGTTMTTAKPVRQNLDNKVSLSGKVTVNPVFGLVAPVAGQVRYLDVTAPTSTPTKPTRVGTVWANGKASNIEVPAGSTFAGRLAEDRATVPAGMPVASARYAGYGIVADIDGAQAYRISDALGSVQAQIKNGPGPFPCTVLGTIAALPAGTIPEPPTPTAKPSAGQSPGQQQMPERKQETEPSTPTGLRLVCTAPPGVKLINGVDATLQVVTEKAANVLTVPVEAVAGTQGKGKVDIVKADGTRETRDVELGLTDGKVVEIRSGLTGDETIAVPGPNLPPAPGGDPNGNGGKGQ
ncbi:efflux RND transporter periplasmic adaptor subunit [Longispora urticae]